MTNHVDLPGVSSHVVVVTEGGPHIWGLVNAVSDALGPVAVIQEQPESKAALLRRRARRLGWVSVAGQFGTMVLVRLAKRFAAAQTRRLVAETGLETEPRRGQHLVEIVSANSPELVKAVRNLRPSVVLLAGCRMLSPAVLAELPCPVLNYHAGITPGYRGMNGGYWALASGDAANFGATVHMVDAGVDTGRVVAQTRTQPGRGDTIAHYPLRLAASSRPMVTSALEAAVAGRLETRESSGPSRQWFHPTLWTYIRTGLVRGVW